MTLAEARDTPRDAMSVLSRTTTTTVVAILLVLSGLAWWVTVRQATSMTDMVSGIGQVGTRFPNDMAVGVFLGMWVAMMVAMMFPTVAPIVLMHRMVTSRRDQGTGSTVVFVGGYLAAWTLAGIVPLGAFLAFRSSAGDATDDRWLAILAGGIVVAAGAYQFTSWKATCLKACRSPMAFLNTHDFGGGARATARAGVSHGLYCLGCCWALMSVLVVVGFMNLTWMGALSLIFLAEKNWRYGVGLTRVAGVALIALGIAIVAFPDLLAPLSGAGGSMEPMDMAPGMDMGPGM